MHEDLHVETDVNGGFYYPLTGFDRGRLVVRAEVEGHASGDSELFDFDERTGATNIVIELVQCGSIEGRVLLAEGDSPAWLLLGAFQNALPPATVRADGSGRFRLAGLMPGVWPIVLMEDWHRPAGGGYNAPLARTIVRPDEVARIEIDLRSLGSCQLLGRILTPDHGPGCWHVILFRDLGARESGRKNTGGDGKFALVADTPGD